MSNHDCWYINSNGNSVIDGWMTGHSNPSVDASNDLQFISKTTTGTETTYVV